MIVWALGAMLLLQDAGTFDASPLQVEVGEPVTLTLRVPHRSDQRIELGEAALVPEELAEAWVALSEPRIQRGNEESVVTWEWLVLEPCELTLPQPPVTLDGQALEVEAGTLTVSTALEPEEDSARAPKPLHETLPPSVVRPWHVLLLPVVVAVLALAFWRVRRRSSSGVEAPSARVRLAGLDLEASEREDIELRAFAIELASLLRGAVDRRAGQDLSAATDEEWLATWTTRGTLNEADVARLEPILERCERVRFGGERPTRLALERDLDQARAFLDSFEARDVQPGMTGAGAGA